MARAKKERAKYVAVIESLDQEGRGVARRDGKVVFIEGALPGEKIEYEVYRSKPSFELGLTTEIYKESPLRVLPKCPYFITVLATDIPLSERQLRRLCHAAPRSACSGCDETKGFDGRLVAYRQDSPRAGAGTDLWLCMEIPPPRSFVRA